MGGGGGEMDGLVGGWVLVLFVYRLSVRAGGSVGVRTCTFLPLSP